jgi:hypothetical protein
MARMTKSQIPSTKQEPMINAGSTNQQRQISCGGPARVVSIIGNWDLFAN